VKYLVAIAACIGCQDDIATAFPPGLEPLEDNPLPALVDGPFDEVLRTRASHSDLIRVYARGFVRVPLDVMWQAAQTPEANVARCKTSEHSFVVGNEPQYDFSFLVHYIVRDLLTVEWDDQWRFGRVADELGMIKHQKVQGSDFVSLSRGTIQVLATSQPDVTELVFVEHLDAISASAADVVEGVQHNYNALVATAHGNPIPRCP
jgi:hypothetical protein